MLNLFLGLNNKIKSNITFKSIFGGYRQFIRMANGLGIIFFDYPRFGQKGFQDPATPVMEGIIDLHHDVMFVLIIICVLVSTLLVHVYKSFSITAPRYKGFPGDWLYFYDIKALFQYPPRQPWYGLSNINDVHHTFLETIWTVFPALILIWVAIPSLALLYASDEVIKPAVTVKIIGNQWYWTYEQSLEYEIMSDHSGKQLLGPDGKNLYKTETDFLDIRGDVSNFDETPVKWKNSLEPFLDAFDKYSNVEDMETLITVLRPSDFIYLATHLTYQDYLRHYTPLIAYLSQLSDFLEIRHNVDRRIHSHFPDEIVREFRKNSLYRLPSEPENLRAYHDDLTESIVLNIRSQMFNDALTLGTLKWFNVKENLELSEYSIEDSYYIKAFLKQLESNVLKQLLVEEIKLVKKEELESGVHYLSRFYRKFLKFGIYGTEKDRVVKRLMPRVLKPVYLEGTERFKEHFIFLAKGANKGNNLENLFRSNELFLPNIADYDRIIGGLIEKELDTIARVHNANKGDYIKIYNKFLEDDFFKNNFKNKALLTRPETREQVIADLIEYDSRYQNLGNMFYSMGLHTKCQDPLIKLRVLMEFHKKYKIPLLQNSYSQKFYQFITARCNIIRRSLPVYDLEFIFNGVDLARYDNKSISDLKTILQFVIKDFKIFSADEVSCKYSLDAGTFASFKLDGYLIELYNRARTLPDTGLMRQPEKDLRYLNGLVGLNKIRDNHTKFYRLLTKDNFIFEDETKQRIKFVNFEGGMAPDNGRTTRTVTRKFDSYMTQEHELRPGGLRLFQVDNELVLPSNTHIRLLVTASDVLHSWALPSAGIKVDACPGRLNQVDVYFTRTGTFYGQCSEICGVNHAFMPIVVRVITPYQFAKYMGVDIRSSNAINKELILKRLELRDIPGYYRFLEPYFEMERHVFGIYYHFGHWRMLYGIWWYNLRQDIKEYFFGTDYVPIKRDSNVSRPDNCDYGWRIARKDVEERSEYAISKASNYNNK